MYQQAYFFSNLLLAGLQVMPKIQMVNLITFERKHSLCHQFELEKLLVKNSLQPH